MKYLPEPIKKLRLQSLLLRLKALRALYHHPVRLLQDRLHLDRLRGVQEVLLHGLVLLLVLRAPIPVDHPLRVPVSPVLEQASVVQCRLEVEHQFLKLRRRCLLLRK
jgi:hypothetical protein